ncbi:hypothetical protein ILFOPFJJ_05571 [Ensifer psoraleae]|nr:hypothetical protein [Sinorhizobium psoraleae]NRP74649.1 hypothetical protein [Sinorhizobium psoraleae]
MSKKSSPGDGTFANGVKGMSPGGADKVSVAATVGNLIAGVARVWHWK